MTSKIALTTWYRCEENCTFALAKHYRGCDNYSIRGPLTTSIYNYSVTCIARGTASIQLRRRSLTDTKEF